MFAGPAMHNHVCNGNSAQDGVIFTQASTTLFYLLLISPVNVGIYAHIIHTHTPDSTYV